MERTSAASKEHLTYLPTAAPIPLEKFCSFEFPRIPSFDLKIESAKEMNHPDNGEDNSYEARI